MNEEQIETAIQESGAKAPRLTPELIDAQIVAEQYHYFIGTLTIACCITLRNGFTVVGDASCISAENFNEEIGRKVSREKARDKIWQLEGYALKERLAMEAMDADMSAAQKGG